MRDVRRCWRWEGVEEMKVEMKAGVGSGGGAAVRDSAAGRVHMANKFLELDVRYGVQDTDE